MKKILFIILMFPVIGYSQISKARQTELEAEYLSKAHYSTKYIQIYSAVHTIKSECELAQAGTLKKNDVLREYNKSVGRYMGRASTFEVAQYRVKKKGDALIKITLLKCAAELALRDAAISDNN